MYFHDTLHVNVEPQMTLVSHRMESSWVSYVQAMVHVNAATVNVTKRTF